MAATDVRGLEDKSAQGATSPLGITTLSAVWGAAEPGLTEVGVISNRLAPTLCLFWYPLARSLSFFDSLHRRAFTQLAVRGVVVRHRTMLFETLIPILHI